MRKAKSLLLVLTGIVLMSCESSLDQVGPNLCPSEDFKFELEDLVIEGLNSDSEVDLNAGGLNIKAAFSEEVKWTLRIYSSESYKLYNGLSNSIDVRWFGNSESMPLFKEGTAIIELEIACLDKLEKPITISRGPTFKNLHSDYGVLLRDFDKHGMYPVDQEVYTSADGWAGFNADGATMYEYFDDFPSPMKGRYVQLHGVNSVPDWYFGGGSFPISRMSDKISTTNADSIFVNFYCKGYQSEYPSTGLEFGFVAAGVNYFYTRPINWDGWNLVSIKLSEFKAVEGARAGEDLQDISSITHCIIQLGANPEKATELKAEYDFILITVGAPFL